MSPRIDGSKIAGDELMEHQIEIWTNTNIWMPTGKQIAYVLGMLESKVLPKDFEPDWDKVAGSRREMGGLISWLVKRPWKPTPRPWRPWGGAFDYTNPGHEGLDYDPDTEPVNGPESYWGGN